jgi:hypothetical protein
MKKQAVFMALAALVASAPAFAQQTVDTGSVGVSGTVSGYVEIRAGGAATLTGNSGGGITSNKTKGQTLSGLSIDLGDLGPSNTNAFVKATVPLRVRSNVAYTISMSVADFSKADAEALQPADVGFGIDNVSRADADVVAGTDTITSGVSGDPTLDSDTNTSTPRFDFTPKKSLAYFLSTNANTKTVLSGPRIMKAIPASANANGLTLNTFFAVKPQFFTAGSDFTTTIIYTVATQ